MGLVSIRVCRYHDLDSLDSKIIKGWQKKPNKNVPQFLLNFSGYKHARRLGLNSLERGDS